MTHTDPGKYQRCAQPQDGGQGSGSGVGGGRNPPSGDLGNLSRIRVLVSGLQVLGPGQPPISSFLIFRWISAWMLPRGQEEAPCIALSAETQWGLGHAALLPSLLQAAA